MAGATRYGFGGSRYGAMMGATSCWEGSNERQSPRPLFFLYSEPEETYPSARRSRCTLSRMGRESRLAGEASLCV